MLKDVEDAVGYREPARVAQQTGPLPEPSVRGALRSAAALGSMAASGVAGAVVAGSLELAVLAGAGAVAAVAHWLRASKERRQHRTVASFLDCDAVVETPGSWTSPDGLRRVRVMPGDDQARFEFLDPVTGETLESFRGPSSAAPPPLEEGVLVERAVATVHGRPVDPRCFSGLPPQLGGRFARLREVRSVAVNVRRDGVLIERLDRDGQLVGDTWHPDLTAALRQLEAEYGAHLGPWRETRADLEEPSTAGRPSWGGPLRSRLGM